jgi:EAL domain-containing protein (putative c-di-GMP-specific phosphodiesterase class I)/CHASE2 domain-containing sensor protein/GGDEF domain-containing protein
MASAGECNAHGQVPDPRHKRRDRLERLACVCLVAAATIALQLLGTFQPLEHWLTASRAQLLDRAPTGQVAIVEIDARSLKEISTWPWSRRYHAQALERLYAAGAELVAFDVDFSSPSEAAGDRAFATALKGGPATILPIFQQRASDDPSQQSVVRSRPAAVFSSAWVGGVNIFPGPDGVVRDYPAATMIGGRIQPSLATLVAENDDFGDRAFEPDWAIDVGRIPRLSFVDVVKGRVPARAIAGKRIIVGATAIELGDRYTIPRFGTVPGVVIQALAAESLLQHRAITRTGALPTLFGVVLVALILGGIAHRRFARTFPLAAIAVLAVLGAAPIAAESRFPLALNSAAMLFCAIACIALRVIIEVRRRVRLSALLDGETGLPNRRALEQDLTGMGPQRVVAAAAIDRFEAIRDTVGSESLAEIVREAAARITTIVDRAVYRIAPDTLAWTESADRAERSSKAVADLFREPVQTGGGAVDIALSIGLNGSIGGATLPQPLIERAMAATTGARALGESFAWYEGSDPAARRQLSMMGELRRGLARGDVVVLYQPQLDLRHGTISHAEALVRWRHPVDGLIGPDQFIPLAESTGVVRELTDFVLSRVAEDSVRLTRGGAPIRFAVNVSAADIGSPAFVDHVVEAIAASGADPNSLTLEITESAIINSPETAVGTLTALRDRGLQLSVDDYGTGQSTLSYVKRLPVHELKIDKCFVTSICDSESDLIMVRSTINLAHELGLRVVAEGVEDERTLQLLRSLGCDLAQGYVIGKPMSLDELCGLADATESGLRAVA